MSEKELYHTVKTQNMQMEVESAKLRDIYSTDNKRIQHMHNNIQGWNVLNFYLWIIYYILVAAILYLLVQDNIEQSKRAKMYLSIGLVLYPFLITTLELFLYNTYDFVRSLILGLPYKKHSNAQPTLTIFDALPPAFYY
jgi:hypothetical protein